jgi:hypothetical protein
MPQDSDDSLTPVPVVGDGVVTVPFPDKENSMAGFDLPDGMASMLASETAGNIQATNTNSREVFRQAAGVLSAVITRIPTEPSVLGSRAVSGVLATPIASPTAQTGG